LVADLEVPLVVVVLTAIIVMISIEMMAGAMMTGVMMIRCGVTTSAVMIGIVMMGAVMIDVVMRGAVMIGIMMIVVMIDVVMRIDAVMEAVGDSTIMIVPLPPLSMFAVRYARFMVTLSVTAGGTMVMILIMRVIMTRKCMLLPMAYTQTGTLTQVPLTTSQGR
jgi:hypothetical protein